MSDNAPVMSYLAGLEKSAIPVWLLDPDHMRIVWANQAAADLWRATSPEELLARDLKGAPTSVVIRTNAIAARIRMGEVVIEDWTLYPKGVPTPVKLHFEGAPLDDGRIGILNQALPSEAGPNPSLLRGIEALRHVPMIVALVAEHGEILMQNPAALSAFGDRTAWAAWFGDTEEADRLVRAALGGENVQRSIRFQTLAGERLHSVHALATKDPVSGRPAVLVHHTDETDRALAQAKADEQLALNERLQSTLALVEKQRNDILALSAPILDVGDDTIAMPIIGQIDEVRTQELVERLLTEITQRRAAYVILDMTSAEVSDDLGVDRLVQLIGAVRLLGARPTITGVQPGLATQLATVGFASANATIARTLADGLARRRDRR